MASQRPLNFSAAALRSRHDHLYRQASAASAAPLHVLFSCLRHDHLSVLFHPNPTRHDVTLMAPQDFPLCAAFQEE